MSYTYQEAYDRSLEYFNEDDIAANTFISKYALRDSEGNFLEKDPSDMHKRMAKELARIERNYKNGLTEDEIYRELSEWKIIPQGSIMSVLGTDTVASLSNCMILPEIPDSYGGIFYADQQLAQLCKRRCGVGLDLSSLRPKGTETNNAAKTSTGAASFMERFSNTTREVAQSGRRGALLETMDVRHPDIEEFVEKKQDLTKVTGANVSVRITDEFMRAVENDDDFVLRYPIDDKIIKDGNGDHGIINHILDDDGYTHSHYKIVRARDLWDKIVSCAHNTAEPGLVFWDRQDDHSPATVYPGFENQGLNPCAEISTQGSDSCRLTALNLTKFVQDPFTDQAYFDHEAFSESVRKAVRLMDDIVDLEIEQIDKIIEKVHNDPEDDKYKQVELDTWKEIRENAVKGRRTGLGITGLGDTLAMLSYQYDGKKGKDSIRQIMHTKFSKELEEQMNLAEERGPLPSWDLDHETAKPFDGYLEDEIDLTLNDFYHMMYNELYYKHSQTSVNWLEEYMRTGRRNISWSTVAPTGSLSIMAQVTSGIEPLFAPYYTRRKKINPSDENARVDFVDQNGDSWQEFNVVHPKFEEWIDKKIDGDEKVGIPRTEGRPDDIQDIDKDNEGHLDILFKNSPYYQSTAPEIDWIDRVEVQSIVQKYTTHSISSTINLPSDVSVDKVKEIYMEAWKRGLKGITVYRDGARSGVLITDKEEEFPEHDAPERPKTLDTDVYHSTSEGKDWVICVGLLNDKPFEVFAYPKNGEEYPPHRSRAKITKQGSGKFVLHDDEHEYVNLAEVMDDKRGAITILASGMLQHGAKVDFVNKRLKKADPNITSFVKAVQRTLSRYNTEEEHESFTGCETPDKCYIKHEEGCITCLTCGQSKCS